MRAVLVLFALVSLAVASPISEIADKAVSVGFTPLPSLNPFNIQDISAACSTGNSAITTNQGVITAKAGLTSSGCETCQSSTGSCSCTVTWGGVDAFTTACTNANGKICYQDISASLNGVTQSYTKLAISCTSTACTDADFKFAAETAATAAWNQAKTAGSASVTVTFCGQSATAAAAGLKASIGLVFALFAALAIALRA